MRIREAQIEDILVGAPRLARDVLRLDEDPLLLGRQMITPSGRVDILYTYKAQLLLVELKVVSFQRQFLQQVLNYRGDLEAFQRESRIVQADIRPYLLCTRVTEREQREAQAFGILCVQYDPRHVLEYFWQHFRPIALFQEVKPIDFGIWNLHLMHRFIYLLEQTESVQQLKQVVKGSPKTLYNKIRFASQLGLVVWSPNSDAIVLSELGKQYIAKRNSALPDRLSDAQEELLRTFVMQNPYSSSVVLGIASVVESVFVLSRNTYPVSMLQLTQYFAFHSGKHYAWQTEKSKYNATRMYTHYAVDLGLLARFGDSVYMTPQGFRFTLQMQMHKSLKMMDTLSTGWLMT